ncbi:hypothetical protein [Thermoflexus sp.]|uniref:hypothetical protein n=1 Tax=Thermoflexus sp. TaxID=1969742 RepID=UPI0035E40410
MEVGHATPDSKHREHAAWGIVIQLIGPAVPLVLGILLMVAGWIVRMARYILGIPLPDLPSWILFLGGALLLVGVLLYALQSLRWENLG